MKKVKVSDELGVAALNGPEIRLHNLELALAVLAGYVLDKDTPKAAASACMAEMFNANSKVGGFIQHEIIDVDDANVVDTDGLDPDDVLDALRNLKDTIEAMREKTEGSTH